MSRKITISISSAVIAINLFLGAVYNGFEQGHNNGSQALRDGLQSLRDQCRLSDHLLHFGVSGESVYHNLSQYHMVIFLSILMYLIFRITEIRVLSQAVRAGAVLIAAFSLGKVFFTVQFGLFGYEIGSFYDLLRETVNLNWISAASILVIAVFEIFETFSQRAGSRDNR